MEDQSTWSIPCVFDEFDLLFLIQRNSVSCLFFPRDPIETFYIRKTSPYNVYPLEPQFYIEKLGFAGVYLFFLFLFQNIDCGYSLEPPRRGGSNVYHNLCFEQK